MIHQATEASFDGVSDRDAGRIRWLGLLPLVFFSVHTLYYLHHGGVSHMLWMCNIGNLVLGLGLLLDWPALIRMSVFWLIPGLPLWIWFMVMKGGWLLTSMFSHVGGLAVGLIGLRRVRADRWAWLHAFAWYLFVQQVCRMFTPPELNVNIAHRIYDRWENVFGTYGQFWLATTLVAGIGLWTMGLLLQRLLPPRPAH